MKKAIAFTLLLSVLGFALQPFAASAQDNRNGAGLANPSIGIGLNGISDWTVQQPFIDVMKTSRTWTGHLPNQWGGLGEKELAADGHLDENGWLKSMPDGVERVAAIVMTDLPPEAVSANGRYRVTYKGEGNVILAGRAGNVERVDGAIWFNYVAGPGFVEVVITKTDPNGTGDYIRDIEIVKEENIPLFEVGAVFNPQWLERIQGTRLIRFMDWMFTNNSTVSEWSERPQTGDYTYTSRGAPVEVMVALANQIGADPWFTMPHMATDAYMRSFAEYVRDNLDPELKAHAEFSNEVWNWQFEQAKWADREAKARWGENAQWVEFYGLRAAQMAMIWDDVFGDAAPARLSKVVATQAGWLGLEEPILTTPLWVAEDPANNKPAATYFDTYAITGYFTGGLSEEAKVPLVKKWIEASRAKAAAEAQRQNLAEPERTAYINRHGYDEATALAAQEIRDGSVSGEAQGTLFELTEKTFPYHGEAARKHGLDLIMYEGGTHVVGSGIFVDDPELTPFFIHLNYTAEMGEIYKTLLDGWKRAGGTVFNAFVDVATPTKWGSWGALRHNTDENPRWDALAAFNRDTPGWWETRAPDAFLHGLTKIAAAGEARLEGTAKADILVGGDGDDILDGAGGADRLNGGKGNDTAILPGKFGDYAFSRKGELVTATSGATATTLYSVETLQFAGEPDLSFQTSEIKED